MDAELITKDFKDAFRFTIDHVFSPTIIEISFFYCWDWK